LSFIQAYGTPDNAEIGFILHNVVDDGTTSRLEIGKALLTGVIDSPNTYFFCYDIGEPEITYTTTASKKKTIQGYLVPVDYVDRLPDFKNPLPDKRLTIYCYYNANG
jgi:hypothetical protein